MGEVRLHLSREANLELLFESKWNNFITAKEKEYGMTSSPYRIEGNSIPKNSRCGCKSILITEFVRKHEKELLDNPYFKALNKDSAIIKVGKELTYPKYKKTPESGKFLTQVCEQFNLTYHISYDTVAEFYKENKGGSFYKIDLYIAALHDDVAMNFGAYLKRKLGEEQITLPAINDYLISIPSRKFTLYQVQEYIALHQVKKKDYQDISVITPVNSKENEQVAIKLERGNDDFRTVSKQNKSHKLVFILVLVSFSALFIYLGFQNSNQYDQKEVKIVKNVVARLLDLSLKAYQSIPLEVSICKEQLTYSKNHYSQSPPLCLQKLRRLYRPLLKEINSVAHGSVYESIALHVGSSVEQGWSLQNRGNPSGYELVSIAIKNLGDTIATIETVEIWKLWWFDNRIDEYVYKYDKKNKQEYTLRKESSGKWQIIGNAYEPDSTVLPPPVVLCSDIEVDWNDKVAVLKTSQQAIKDGNISKGLRCVECYNKFKGGSNTTALIYFIQTRVHLYQDLNVGNNSRERFEQKKKQLNQGFSIWLSKYFLSQEAPLM